MDQKIINRETYSGLDFLGDLGGLFDALYILGGMLIAPVSGFALNAKLLSNLFQAYESQKENIYKEGIIKDIQEDFQPSKIEG